jgi:hypothetical protein
MSAGQVFDQLKFAPPEPLLLVGGQFRKDVYENLGSRHMDNRASVDPAP